MTDFFKSFFSRKIQLEPLKEYREFPEPVSEKKFFSKPTPWWCYLGFLLLILIWLPFVNWKKLSSFTDIFGVTSHASNVALLPARDSRVIELQPGQELIYVIPDQKNPMGKPSFMTGDREPLKKPSQKFFYVPTTNNEWKVVWIFKEK